MDKLEFKNVRQNKYGNTTITGNIEELNIGTEYTVTGVPKSGKYGVSYEVKNIRRDKPTTPEATKAFLYEILTPNQAEAMYNAYPDIVDRVINNRLDDIDLSKTYNIKSKIFEVIKRKIIANFKLAELVDDFQGVFSFNIIKKLFDAFPSVEKIKESIINNPYGCLCGINGIGFKTADELLLKVYDKSKANISEGKPPIIPFEGDLRTSFQRMKAAAIYVLEENESSGNTYLDIKKFKTDCLAMAPEAKDQLVEVIKDDIIHFDKDNLTVGKASTYKTEHNIAKQMAYGALWQKIREKYIEGKEDDPFYNTYYVEDAWRENNCADSKWKNIDVSKYRLLDGFELTDKQLQTLEKMKTNNLVILNGYGGCVDADTEFFTGKKWKKISDYQIGDKVLQYNKNGKAELIIPVEYHKYKSDYLWSFKTKYGLDQCLSDEHNVFYITSKGNLYSKTFKEVKRDQQEGTGFKGKFITTFDFQGTGINYSDDEIRLKVAIKADGHYPRNCNDYCVIRLKKKRKQKRLEQLLKNLNITYKIKDEEKTGFKIYTFHYKTKKTYDSKWYNCNKHQLEIIFEEVFYWDGRYNGLQYFTVIKEDADYLQFVGASLGYRGTIKTDDRRGQGHHKSIEYSVCFSKRNLVGMCVDNRIQKTKINQYKTIDGYKYCFTTNSGMWIMRRNNQIVITGNSGKSSSTKALINMMDDNKITYKIMAPTGRAAKVISNYTKRPASTIHRGLRFSPPNDWGLNKNNPIHEDVVIVDEFSMTDVFICEKLVDAIDFKRTKLLIIGDDAQIPSVGAGNVLYDLLSCKLIPTITLDKIFRYGAGGLATAATDTRNCKKYLDPNNSKMQIFGEDKSYVFFPLEQEKIVSNVVSLYKKLLNDGYKTDDMIVLSCFNVGKYGTEAINKAIQKAINLNDKEIITHGETEFMVGDNVIQTKNDYRAKVYSEENIPKWNQNRYEEAGINFIAEEGYETGEEVFVPNGEIGKICRIESNYLVVQYDDHKIKYTKDKLLHLKLAYAISTHKSQGGQFKVVIFVTPKAHTYMLNSNLLYVGESRAQEKCFHIGEVATVHRALGKKENFDRKTYLQDLLKTEFVELAKEMKKQYDDNMLNSKNKVNDEAMTEIAI